MDLTIRRRGASFLALCALVAFLGGCGGGGSRASSTDDVTPDDDPPPPNATVAPSQDVYVDASAPSTNFNTNVASCSQCRLSLKVMPGASPCWTYLKYDLSDALPITPGKTLTIVDANLHIEYLGGVMPNTDDDVSFGAYRCSQPWAEGAITWSRRATYGSRIGTVLVQGTRFDCYMPISTATVQSWVDAPATNYGLVLIGSGGSYSDSCKTMPSREYNPQGITLDINYTLH